MAIPGHIEIGRSYNVTLPIFKPLCYTYRMMNAVRKVEAQKKVGGIPFFISLLMLLLIDATLSLHLPLCWTTRAEQPALATGAGIVIGFGLAFLLLRGSFATILHEWKHAVVSTLAGNKWKKMRVNHEEGAFEYEYSKATAIYNSFIVLAPYTFPAFLFPAALVCIGLYHSSPLASFILLGVGLGADLAAHLRETKPWQLDLQEIRGGFLISVLFVALMNMFFTLVVMTWAFGQGAAFLSLAAFSLTLGSYGLQNLMGR